MNVDGEFEVSHREVVPHPVVQPAQYYEALQVQQLLASMAQRGDQPIIIQTPAPERPGLDVNWGEVIRWLAVGVAAIIICAMVLVTCSAQPPPPPPAEVHKPSCVVLC